MDYHNRFSPSYQIPYQPILTTAQQEIERSLNALEHKLKRVPFGLKREDKSIDKLWIYRLAYKEILPCKKKDN